MHGFTLFLASKTEEENQLLRRKIETLQGDFPQLQFSGVHPQGLALSAHERMGAVVINVPEWNRAEAANLKSLHEAGYRGPVLVTAKATASESLRHLRAIDHVVFLEKPFDSKDLQGIVRKMLSARKVAQRVHRRFNTDELAEIEFYGRNDCYRTKVSNISKGGAFLEFMSTAPISIGDIVRIKVELKDVRRVYTVPARVVWTHNPNGLSTEVSGTGVGVEFVGAPDVKQTMLKSY